MTIRSIDPSDLISASPQHIQELTFDLTVAQEHWELFICRGKWQHNWNDDLLNYNDYNYPGASLMAAQEMMRIELDSNHSPFFRLDIATIARCLNFTSSSLRNISKRSNMLLWWGLSSWMFSSGWRVWEHNDLKFVFKKNTTYHLPWHYQSFPACW